jgi:hypothetical protein
MNLNDEYETYIGRLKETDEGNKLFLNLPEISKALYRYVSENTKQYPLIQTALHWMSEKEVSGLLEKNFVLILGRILHIAKNFDALLPNRKAEMLLDFLSLLKEEQERWREEYKKHIEHIHDKAERRKRRKELLAHETAAEARDKPCCEKAISTLFEKVLPHGADSLFLPSIAKQFLPNNFIESFVQKNIDSLMKAIHAKKWKESFLYLIITLLFRDVFVKKYVPQTAQGITIDLHETYIEKGEQITSWLLELLSIVDSRIKFLAKHEAMQKALSVLEPYLASFSLERGILVLIMPCLLGNNLSGDLDLLIDKVSGDPKAIAFLLKKVFSLSSSPEKINPQAPLGELLMLGVKGAVKETAITDKAASLVYQEIPLKIFQQVRLFILSSYFDRYIYRAFQNFSVN